MGNRWETGGKGGKPNGRNISPNGFFVFFRVFFVLDYWISYGQFCVMSRQVVHKGSDFELTLAITDKEGAPLAVSGVDDVIVLVRSRNGTDGRLGKFKKTAATGVLAWTASQTSTSEILCVIPEAAINAASEGYYEIGVKVKTNDGHNWVEVLDHELVIKNNALSDE